MRVLFDHQAFTDQEYGGISRYYFELISRFGADENVPRSSLLLSSNAYLNSSYDSRVVNFFPKRSFKGKKRIIRFVNELSSNFQLTRGEFDIFHPTYYNPYFLKRIGQKPFVVTFYDMIHEKFSNRYTSLELDKELVLNKKLLFQKASKVIAISQTTKNDIMEIYGVSGENIEVVYLGSSLQPTEVSFKPSLVLAEPYLLFVGNRDKYKNFRFYIESVAELLKKESILFVCAGGGDFRDDEKELLKKLGIANLVRYYPIDDNRLSNLYSNALAFVFPSLYEGFGIPVLEAFSCGCPCLLSKGGSLPEVGGEAARYFDGEDSESVVSSLRDIICNESLRNELSLKGYERIKQFSWDRMYKDTIGVYNSVL